MVRQKNALRQHLVAEFESRENVPSREEFNALSRWIPTITDDSDDQQEESSYYDGDGTINIEVTGISERWTVNGTYDSEDAAQSLIVSKKRRTGDGRRVWHLIIQPSGEAFLEVATATDIRGGSGEASDYEEFNAVLNYDRVAREVDPETLEDVNEEGSNGGSAPDPDNGDEPSA